MQGGASFAGFPVLLTSWQQLDRVGGKCLELFPGLWALLPVRTWLWILGFVFQLISGAAVLWSFSSNYISPVGFSIEFPRLFCVSTFQINTEAPRGHSTVPCSPPCLFFPASFLQSLSSVEGLGGDSGILGLDLLSCSQDKACRDSKTQFWHQCTYCGHFSEAWLSRWRLESPSIK